MPWWPLGPANSYSFCQAFWVPYLYPKYKSATPPKCLHFIARLIFTWCFPLVYVPQCLWVFAEYISHYLGLGSQVPVSPLSTLQSLQNYLLFPESKMLSPISMLFYKLYTPPTISFPNTSKFLYIPPISDHWVLPVCEDFSYHPHQKQLVKPIIIVQVSRFHCTTSSLASRTGFHSSLKPNAYYLNTQYILLNKLNESHARSTNSSRIDQQLFSLHTHLCQQLTQNT